MMKLPEVLCYYHYLKETDDELMLELSQLKKD